MPKDYYEIYLRSKLGFAWRWGLIFCHGLLISWRGLAVRVWQEGGWARELVWTLLGLKLRCPGNLSHSVDWTTAARPCFYTNCTRCKPCKSSKDSFLRGFTFALSNAFPISAMWHTGGNHRMRIYGFLIFELIIMNGLPSVAVQTWWKGGHN
jgi:hypothetical protein